MKYNSDPLKKHFKMSYVLGSFTSRKVIRRVRARKMVCLASLWVSHPDSPFLHSNWSFTGSRWVIGWRFSVWCGGHVYFQTQHERVQSSVVNVINEEAGNLLSVFLVAVIVLPRAAERNFTIAEHMLGTDGEVPRAVWRKLLGACFLNFCLPCESPFHLNLKFSSQKSSYLNINTAKKDLAVSSSHNRICCIWKNLIRDNKLHWEWR